MSSALPTSTSRAPKASSRPRAGRDAQYDTPSLGDAFKTGRTHVTADAAALIALPEIDVIVEATGDPKTGIRFALQTIAAKKHIVMVNVEADVLAGPLLASKARAAGVVYSLAWGDQPALICEHVDWARACGFKVISAGKGTRYHPTYHRSTPDTVWEILDKYLRIDDRKSINPKMFNSFIDGTKSGIEMSAVCNATGLMPQTNGLSLPAREPLRSRRRVQAEERRRHAGKGGRDRSGVVGRSRGARHSLQSRDGHLCGVRGRDRLRAALLSRISPAAGQERAVSPRSIAPCT